MTLDQPWAPVRAIIRSTSVDYKALSPAELIGLCVRGDEMAWNEFIRRYNPIIARTVARIGRRWDRYSPDLVNDLVRVTYLKLCDRQALALREFRSEDADAFFGYLKKVAANAAIDYLKKHFKLETVPLEEYFEPVPHPRGRAALTPSEVKLLFEQFEAYLHVALPLKTRDRDCRIFRLYYQQGLTAAKIAALPVGLTVEGVEAAIHRLVLLLRKFVE